MTAPQHFFVSFTSSLLGASLLAVTAIVFQDWLTEHGVPATLLALGLFITAHLLIRWYFQNCVPILCKHCHQKTCYAIPGRSDRFRCEVCGADS